MVSELVPFYELAAFNFMEVQKSPKAQMASSILLVYEFLHRAGYRNRTVEVCKRFCKIYYEEELHNPKLDVIAKPLILDRFHEAKINVRRRNLERQHIDHVLHLATALGDCDAVKLVLGAHASEVNLLTKVGHCSCNGPNHECGNTTQRSGFSALYLAIRQKNQTMVELLLNSGANPSTSYGDNFTPLHAAAEWGNKEVVEVLLNKGAEIDAPYSSGEDDCGYTPLHVAAEQGHEDIVVLLLERGAQQSAECRHIDHSKWPPIYFAVLRGHEGVVRILLEKGAGLDPILDGDKTLLSIAASHGHEAVVKFLVRFGVKTTDFKKRIKEAARKAVKNEDRTSLKTLLNAGALGYAYSVWDHSLHVVILEQEIELVEICLVLGEDVNRAEWDQKSCCSITPLFSAIMTGRGDIVDLLLKYGADIRKGFASDNYTAILVAAKFGRLENFQMLLELGGDPHLIMGSALLEACFKGNIEDVKLLLDCGVDANFQSASTPSLCPLFLAAYSHPYRVGPDPPHAIVRLLLERGADVNTKLNGGVTLLHECLTFHKEDYGNDIPESLFYFLLEKGATVNAEDDEGQTPLHYIAQVDVSIQLNHYEIPSHIRHLVSKGANIYARDEDNKTPIDIAVGPAHKELLRIQEQQRRDSFLESESE